MHHNPYTDALSQIKKSEPLLASHVRPFLPRFLSPERILEVSLPVKMDDGSTRVFTGYRSQYSSARGPYKGGIRFHPWVTRDEVIALSLWMALKTALLDLPLGGWKGGVIVDPKALSASELERLSRAYSAAIAPLIGPDMDIPAPDVNTDSRIMGYMVDEYSRLKGEWTPGVFTGKALSIGGSLGRDSATARWWLFVLLEYLKSLWQDLTGKTAAIQWSGNAGLTMARLLADRGARVVAISDSSAALIDMNGLNVAQLESYKREKKSYVDATFAEKIAAQDLLTLDVDILVPAALEGQITAENAVHIRAKTILELANGPTTSQADEILFGRGITVLPDILANAGGVTVSYFEQVQNSMNYAWTREEVTEKLESRMRHATRGVIDFAQKHSTHFRTAAQALALTRILEAMQGRGW